jgi:hypothetical protein
VPEGHENPNRHRAEASRSITLLKWEGVQSVLFALLYLVLRRLIGFAGGFQGGSVKGRRDPRPAPSAGNINLTHVHAWA